MSESKLKIPRHVAVIMDGNGRWATRQGKERLHGHIAGVESVRRILHESVRYGVKYLTLYAFSTENWGRPQAEVNGLMELLCQQIAAELPEFHRQKIAMRFIGDRSELDPKVISMIEKSELETAQYDTLTLIIAFNYSARWELTRAARILAQKAQHGEIHPEQIDEAAFAEQLTTAAIPDPDLLIRTSGECRLSNFLLWQCAYTEFYFTDTLWPDFDEKAYARALEIYSSRDRRYGLIHSSITE